MSRSALLLTVAALAAAGDVEPAKLATSDAVPLDPGATELALGGMLGHATSGFDTEGTARTRAGDRSEGSLALGLTHGLRDGLDMGLALGWTVVEDQADEPRHGNGPTDLVASAKWRFWRHAQGGDAWAAALLPSITAPMGRSQDAGTELPTASRCWTAGLALAGSGNIGAVALNADVGYARAYGRAEDRDGHLGTVTADAALGVQVSASMQPEIDLSWTQEQVEEGEAPWSLAVLIGAQASTPFGRLGMGVQRVVAGADVDAATIVRLDLTMALE